MIGDWEKGWEIQVQLVAVQSKPKRMQKGDVGMKSLYIPSIRPMSEGRIQTCVHIHAKERTGSGIGR